MKSEKFLDELAIAASQNVEEKNYWLNKLEGEMVKSYFPYDCNKKTKHECCFEVVKSVIPEKLYSRLMELSNGSDVRLFTIMVTGLVILLAKYTHNKDIIVGTSIYKQNTDTTFINTVLPLRNQVRDSMTFKELLLQVGQCIFQAYKHQNYPLEILLKLLDIPFLENDDFPLFDIGILAENLHDKELLRHIHLNLIFLLKRTDEGIEVNVEYNPLLYRRTTLTRIVSHFLNLLKNVLFNVNLPVSGIDILAEAERKEILFDFNDTKAGYSQDKTMHLLFEEQVEKTPDHTALIGQIPNKDVPFGQDINAFGETSLRAKSQELRAVTYKELNKKSNQLARELRNRSVKPNHFVAVVMDRSPEMVIGVMAILKAGGAYVPLEPYLPEARIITCLSSLNVEYLLTNQVQLPKIDKVSCQLPELKNIFCLDGDVEPDKTSVWLFIDKAFISPGAIRKNPAENLLSAASAADIAYVIFTSGTTGTPKGVIEQHRPVINIIQWVNQTYDVTGWEKLLFVASLGFDLSVYDIFGILTTGGSLRVVGGDELKLPEHLLEVIFKEGITFWDSAPAALQQLVPFLLELKETQQYKTSALRLVFLSGDWIPVTIADILKAVFKGVNVIGLGGATEATIWSNYYPIEVVDHDWNSIPYGKPIQNAKYYILEQSLNPCPIGVPGDLYIGGECLASGYINDIELTAYKFLNNPFVPGEKMYRTGDIAQWFPDGNMEFLGRLDNQVKIRGYRIELGEIESQLNLHPEIKSAVVIARGKEKDDKYLCAYYVANKEFATIELSEYLSKTLPDYMIPTYFIKLGKIPITPNGKLDRKALPGHDSLVDMKKYTPPRNETDKNIVEIWSEILQMNQEKISIDADFFELGGHSLSATKLITTIHKELNVKVPLAELFKNPTVRKLSKTIKGLVKEQYIAISQVEEKDYYPVSSPQKRLYVLHRLDETSTRYNMTMALQLDKYVDKDQLENTFKKLIRRHESLRTSFIMPKGEPVQRIHKSVDFTLEYYEVAEGELESQGAKKIIKKSLRGFDLSHPPLLRVGLVKLAGEQYILVVDIHHIISDGLSNYILEQEFRTMDAGEQSFPLKIHYKDFSEWQNHLTASSDIKKQEQYWLNRFKDDIPVLNMPLDFPLPLVYTAQGSKINFETDYDITAKIQQLVLETETTLYIVLMSAYTILLSKYSRQEDIVVGSPLAGRRHADLENIIGLFVNMLPMRNQPKEEKTFTEFLAEVKANVLEAHENQEYPFENLVWKLKLTDDSGRNPLFDAVFVLQNRMTTNIPVSGNATTSGFTADDADLTNKMKITNYEVDLEKVHHELLLNVIEEKDKLSLDLEYSTELYKESTARKMTQHYIEILNQIVTNRDIKLKDIAISHELIMADTGIIQEEQDDFEF